MKLLAFTGMVLVLMGQSLGAGSLGSGALGSGALGSGALGGSLGVSEKDCMGAPAVDYDARTLAYSEAANVTAWGSVGTVAGWDMAQGTVGDQPRMDVDCGNGVPCVFFVDGTDHLRSAAASATWTKNIYCTVFKGTATNDEVIYQWSDASATVFRNSFLQRTSDYQIVGNASTTKTVGGTKNTWNSICIDITDPTAGTYSTSGASVAALGTLTSADDPDRATVGTGFPQAGGWTFAGGRIGRVVMYTEDPGSTLQELSACLKTQWAF